MKERTTNERRLSSRRLGLADFCLKSRCGDGSVRAWARTRRLGTLGSPMGKVALRPESSASHPDSGGLARGQPTRPGGASSPEARTEPPPHQRGGSAARRDFGPSIGRSSRKKLWISPRARAKRAPRQCAVSLAVERPLHTRKVTGSNPVPRTPSESHCLLSDKLSKSAKLQE